MDISKFLLNGHRRRDFNKEVWIPLRAHVRTENGEFGQAGYTTEVFGAGSVAIRTKDVPLAKGSLNWFTNGLRRDHKGYVQNRKYFPADVFEGDGFLGVNLVIAQEGSHGDPPVWHPHPDLIATLNLRREDNHWLAADEGFAEAIRYIEDADRIPRRLEIRADFLKDYLCARKMALCISSYSERDEVVADIAGTNWTAFGIEPRYAENQEPEASKPFRGEWTQELEDGRWEGRVTPIHEGGHEFGSGFAILHVGRKPIDPETTIPEISPGDEMESSKREGVFKGKLVYRISGEIWRDQWVLPGSVSVRVRGDDPPSIPSFIIDAEGTRVPSKKLEGGGRWLWFNPAVINESLRYRGANLTWYTRDTGRIEMAKNYGAVFGVNNLGLINVYAKDIAFLPLWQQIIWSGFNIAPDGGVGGELLASQAEGRPAETLAPEAFLLRAREDLDRAVQKRFGKRAFRGHAKVGEVASRCHRFRSLDRAGLLALAKDLALITADDIDQKQLQEIVPPKAGEKLGSLKSLERLIAKVTDESFARTSLSALFHIYDLRLADAHLPSSETESTLLEIGLDPKLPFVLQGRDMLVSLVDALYRLIRIIENTSGKSS